MAVLLQTRIPVILPESYGVISDARKRRLNLECREVVLKWLHWHFAYLHFQLDATVQITLVYKYRSSNIETDSISALQEEDLKQVLELVRSAIASWIFENHVEVPVPAFQYVYKVCQANPSNTQGAQPAVEITLDELSGIAR